MQEPGFCVTPGAVMKSIRPPAIFSCQKGSEFVIVPAELLEYRPETPRYMKSPSRHIAPKPLLLLVLALAGCSPGQLTGIVRNIEGEALPGVSIHISGSDASALSNTRGEYSISADPGEHELTFAKTGYTLSSITVAKNEDGDTPVPDVRLWNLPSQKSVYLYHDTHYTEATRITPQRYYMTDGTIDYGTQRDPDAQTPFGMPQIMFYRTPRYDARLARLQPETAQLHNDDSQTFEVWTAAGSVSIELELVESFDPTLMRLRFEDPLQPGRYAVHWGALDGYDTIDPRIYLFEVLPTADISLDEVAPIQENVPIGPHKAPDDAP